MTLQEVNIMKCIINPNNIITKRPLLFTSGLAFMLNFLVEILSRRSLFKCVEYIINEPVIFIYNALIIMLTLSFALLFSKRIFALTLISLLWLTGGVVNFIILGFRMTPFAATDLSVLNSAFNIIDKYFTPLQIVLMALTIILILSAIIFLYIKCPKTKTHYLKSALLISAFSAILIGGTNVSIKANALSGSFPNLADAYDEYGFAYCFSQSIIDNGIDEPEDYSEEAMKEITDKLFAGNSSSEALTKDNPNIVMVQLESFFDPEHISGIKFSRDPVPVFRELKKNYSSGYLTVPAVGAGTSNTEFELLTGMSLDFFGAGEYPYKTILKSSTCESIPFNLKELGYSSHAIHNNTSTFYNRNDVFSMLGFDSFTGLEYINNVQYTSTGWAKDNVLSSEILKALGSTETRDFVFTITVQDHGKYPEEASDNPQGISVYGIEEDSRKNQFEYYANQLSETDAFIGNLTASLKACNEPVVLVLYGDHLPGLNLTDENLSNGNLYQTEYVIWDNIGLEKNNCDMYSYQLSSYVSKLLGFNNGIITKLHQSSMLDSDYQHDLELLEYDMLYGKKYVYNEASPYAQSELKMGTTEISISGSYVSGGRLYITGSSFTPYSRVFIEDSEQETVYVDENTLIVESPDISEGDNISVAQISDDKQILSRTGAYIFSNQH